MGCEALATKAELAALQAELTRVRALAATSLSTANDAKARTVALDLSKLDRSEKQPIIDNAVSIANQIFQPQIAVVGITAGSALGIARIVQAGLAGLAAIVTLLEPLIPFVLVLIGIASIVADLYNRIFAVDNKVTGLERHYDAVIEVLETDLKHTRQEANTATIKANASIEESKKATVNAHAARKEANEATKKANDAAHSSMLATGKANEAREKANLATVDANNARQIANNSIVNSNLAMREANLASNDAALAQKEANQATEKANRLSTYINELITSVNRTIKNIEQRMLPFMPFTQKVDQNTQDINRLKNNIVTVGDSLKIYLPKVLEPTIIDRVITTTRALVPLSIADASRQITSNFETAQNDIKNLHERQRQQALKDMQMRGEFTGIQTKIQSLETSIAQIANPSLTNTEPRVRAIERKIADVPRLSDKITSLEQTQANINTKVDEQAQVNTQTLPMLRDIQERITQMPVAIPLAVGAIVPLALTRSQPFTQKLVDAAAAGTCETTKPGGCMGNQFNRQNGKLDDLLRKADLGIQAGQGAALARIESLSTTINRKLGAEIPGFGIGGKLTNFVNFALADRVVNLVTMVASVHNLFMLSNSIQQTFFSAIDNVLQVGSLIGNPDGTGSIDSRTWLTSNIDSFFSSLFGATEWAAVKVQWKTYSTIASTSAQAVRNLQEIHNDSQELLNQGRNYTAQLGNALVDEGMISEDNWDYKDPDVKIKSKNLNRLDRMGRGLETLSNQLEAIEQVTATVLNIAQTANEVKENIDTINKAINDANNAAKTDRAAKVEGLELPNFSLGDIF